MEQSPPDLKQSHCDLVASGDEGRELGTRARAAVSLFDESAEVKTPLGKHPVVFCPAGPSIPAPPPPRPPPWEATEKGHV